MLSSAFLLLLLAVIAALISPLLLLPDVAIPDGMASAIAVAQGYIAVLSAWLGPAYTTLWLVIRLIIALELTILAYRVIMWIIRKIPGVS